MCIRDSTGSGRPIASSANFSNSDFWVSGPTILIGDGIGAGTGTVGMPVLGMALSKLVLSPAWRGAWLEPCVVPVEGPCPAVEPETDWVDSVGVVSTDWPAQRVQGSRNSKNAFDLIRRNSSDSNGYYVR